MRRLPAVAALLALGLTILPLTCALAAPALGDVALVDQSGSDFHLRDLAGRRTAITFVATRCRETCPIVNAVFGALARQRRDARLVTVSLDPRYDTPIVMANYARELNARAPGWRFVTGRAANIAVVLRAFGVTVENGADGIPDAHSNFIYILDARGRLQTTLPLSSHAVADVRRALAG